MHKIEWKLEEELMCLYIDDKYFTCRHKSKKEEISELKSLIGLLNNIKVDKLETDFDYGIGDLD